MSYEAYTKKTSYELWRKKKSNISYFHPFSCKYFFHYNGKNYLGNLIEEVTQESEAGEDQIYSFKLAKDISKVSTEDLTEESTTAKVESTIPTAKENIPREWRHNASYA